MATVVRANGDSQVTVNVGDSLSKNANAVIINNGIASPLKAYKIGTFGSTANLAAELGAPSAAGVTGAVQTLLTVVSSNATVLAYQVDAAGASAQLSVLVERSGWGSDADLQAAVRGLAANIGSKSTITTTSAAVSSTGGIKLA